VQKLLVAAVAVVVLLVGAAVPALALNTQAWEERRIATEAFDEAAGAALDASDDAAVAAAELAEAREEAEPVLEDARAVAEASPGYFNSAVLDPLSTAVADLEAALATEAPDGLTMPETKRPETIEQLRAAVEPLFDWTNSETERAVLVTGVATRLSDATVTARDAVLALAASVEAEASGALAAAPLATTPGPWPGSGRRSRRRRMRQLRRRRRADRAETRTPEPYWRKASTDSCRRGAACRRPSAAGTAPSPSKQAPQPAAHSRSAL
jgi:hypothetical protein